MRREEHAWREKERERERRRRKTERRKNARRRSEGSERRGSEKRKTAKIGGNEKKGSTISIMTRTTEEVRGAIERGIAIALLIATMIKVGASLAQKAKVGQRCPIASKRVSPINLF